jgi:hypothetical protein
LWFATSSLENTRLRVASGGFLIMVSIFESELHERGVVMGEQGSSLG